MHTRGRLTNRTLFSDTDENVLTILAQLDHLRKIQPPAFLVNSPVLSAQQIATFVETAYWSSLLASEGTSTSVRIAAVMRKSFAGLPQFSAPVPFDEGHTAKLAPAVPPRGCLLVDPETLQIFAICRQPLSLDATITVDVVRPGVVQVGIGVYRTFVVFSGRRTTPVLAAGNDLAHSIRTVLRIVLPADDFIETQAVWREALALADVARAVRTNGHGGALLFVPDDDDAWSVSIDPFGFRLDVRDGAILDSIRAELKTTQQAGAALQALWQSTISEGSATHLSAQVREFEQSLILFHNGLMSASAFAEGAHTVTEAVLKSCQPRNEGRGSFAELLHKVAEAAKLAPEYRQPLLRLKDRRKVAKHRGQRVRHADMAADVRNVIAALHSLFRHLRLQRDQETVNKPLQPTPFGGG